MEVGGSLTILKMLSHSVLQFNRHHLTQDDQPQEAGR
jgi:hypothetical protein